MTTTRTPEGDRLRKEAAQHEQDAYDSFERSDTDGALSQWASQCMAAKRRLEAEIADNGGVWTFPVLLDLKGNFVPARVIEGRYGKCWMLLDSNGDATGQFLNYRPKKPETLARKGYREARCIRPARARLGGALGWHAYAYPTEPAHLPPAEIIEVEKEES